MAKPSKIRDVSLPFAKIKSPAGLSQSWTR